MNTTTSQFVLLNVGAGNTKGLIPMSSEWREVTVDVEPETNPDILAHMTNLEGVGTESVDKILAKGSLEHLFAHEVPLALAEFYRVLKPGCEAFITTPDLTQVCEEILRGGVDSLLYESSAGPIAAIDVLYGHRPSIESGEVHMAHHTGFTEQSLFNSLQGAGFELIEISHKPVKWFNGKTIVVTLAASALKPKEERKNNGNGNSSG